MGNISSKDSDLPNYNQVFKSNEIELNKTQKQTNCCIYHEICNHYNLGNKFDTLKKYFINLTYDDIYNYGYINYVELASTNDKIIMSVFNNKYISLYKYYKRNLNKVNVITKLKDSCENFSKYSKVLDELKNKLNDSLKEYYNNKKEFIETRGIMQEFNKECVKECVKEALRSIFDLNEIEKILNA